VLIQNAPTKCEVCVNWYFLPSWPCTIRS